jgi:hypothetical protein
MTNIDRHTAFEVRGTLLVNLFSGHYNGLACRMNRSFSMKSGHILMIANALRVLVVVLVAVVAFMLPTVDQGKDDNFRNKQLREAAAYGALGAINRLLPHGLQQLVRNAHVFKTDHDNSEK